MNGLAERQENPLAAITDYEDNPVLDHEGARIDTPRPFWHAPTGRWIAPTYDFFTNNRGELRRCVGFYSSENLTDCKSLQYKELQN